MTAVNMEIGIQLIKKEHKNIKGLVLKSRIKSKDQTILIGGLFFWI
jgi:hypothetical protein